jgi:hypothetical protein
MLLPESGVSRSFTRFLLPLTDIMIILFSMFLLMPHLEEKKPPPSPADIAPGWQADQQFAAQEQLQRYRRLEAQPLSERSLVKVIHIDFQGRLVLPRQPEPMALTMANAAQALAEDVKTARDLHKELFYMLLRPLPVNGIKSDSPDPGDIKNYEQVFNEVRRKHPTVRISFEVVDSLHGG